MPVRTISCVGSNDIGILTCFVIAQKCPEIRVIILDKPEIISEWNSDVLPICDDEIEDIVKKCRNRNLFFNSDYPTAFRTSEVIFISLKGSVKTQMNGERRTFDFKQIDDVARKITTYADSNRIVVEKSTTPIRTADRISQILQATCEPGIKIDVLSNPEFLNEGSIVQNLLNPEIVLIGCAPHGKPAARILSSVYERWIPQKNINFISIAAAEEIKLAGTAYLLQQTATTMAVTRVSRETRTDLKEIRRFVGLDTTRKIYGDVKQLMKVCECLKIPEIGDYWDTVREKHKIYESTFFDKYRPLDDKVFVVFGISRDLVGPKSANPTSIDTCKWLLSEKANINVWEPKMQIKQIIRMLDLENVEDIEVYLKVFEDVYKAVEGASIIVCYSDFREFLDLNLPKMMKLMDSTQPKVFLSGLKLSIPEEEQLRRMGFEYENLWEEEK